MGLNNTAVTKFGCTITTVDAATNQIEGVTRTGSPVNATVVATSVAWRWPVVGELWMARQENGQWFLDGPMASDPNSTAEVTLFDVPPGDAVINSSTGTVHIMGSSDGGSDFTFNAASFGTLTGVVLAAIDAPVTINGNEINTGKIMQSITGTFGISSASGYGGSGIPNQVGPVSTPTITADLYADSSGGNIFQLAAYVNNTGSRPTVAVFGEAQGKHAWGGNFCGFTQHTSDIAYGIELDTANLGGAGQASGQATALFMVESTNEHITGSPANTGYAMLMEAATGATGWAQGIVFESNPVQATGALITAFSPVNVHNGIDLSGAVITNSAVSIPINSGSSAGSTGLLIRGFGGSANSGNAIQIQAGDALGSTMGGGILFHHSVANGDPVVSTGSLIKADGGTYATGLDFSAATFTTAAINVGAGQIKFAAGSTASGSAALGANCPAVTPTAPNTWLKVLDSTGAQLFVPAWK